MSLSQYRILLVEDSSPIRQSLKKIFSTYGFGHIQEAFDGQQALMALRSAVKEGKPFDLVFSDIWMPQMDGIMLLKTVREDPELKNVPFILVTTENNKSIVMQAVMSGISGYVMKPFTADEVRGKIDELFNRAPTTA